MRPPSCLGSTVQGAVQGGGVDQHMHRAVIGAGGHCTGRAGVGQGARVCDTTGSQLLHFSASQPGSQGAPLLPRPASPASASTCTREGPWKAGRLLPRPVSMDTSSSCRTPALAVPPACSADVELTWRGAGPAGEERGMEDTGLGLQRARDTPVTRGHMTRNSPGAEARPATRPHSVQSTARAGHAQRTQHDVDARVAHHQAQASHLLGSGQPGDQGGGARLQAAAAAADWHGEAWGMGR